MPGQSVANIHAHLFVASRHSLHVKTQKHSEGIPATSLVPRAFLRRGFWRIWPCPGLEPILDNLFTKSADFTSKRTPNLTYVRQTFDNFDTVSGTFCQSSQNLAKLANSSDFGSFWPRNTPDHGSSGQITCQTQFLKTKPRLCHSADCETNLR